MGANAVLAKRRGKFITNIRAVQINGVKIVGETDILNTVKHVATKLYSENVRKLIELYIENSDDEIFVEMNS